jgi:hypothetical protein
VTVLLPQRVARRKVAASPERTRLVAGAPLH